MYPSDSSNSFSMSAYESGSVILMIRLSFHFVTGCPLLFRFRSPSRRGCLLGECFALGGCKVAHPSRAPLFPALAALFAEKLKCRCWKLRHVNSLTGLGIICKLFFS